MTHKSLRSQESLENYKKIRNETKSLVKQLKNQHWEMFSRRMESDFYGLQKQIWRMIMKQRKEVNDLIEVHHITEEAWVSYITTLFERGSNSLDESDLNINGTNNDATVSYLEVVEALKALKNRKSPGQDGIPNELLKYGGHQLTNELLKLINKIVSSHTIPNKWRTSIMIPLFKKGDRREPRNYRGINLLDSALKLTTKIITKKINSLTTLE